jgi:hypothetical protein
MAATPKPVRKATKLEAERERKHFRTVSSTKGKAEHRQGERSSENKARLKKIALNSIKHKKTMSGRDVLGKPKRK